MADILKPLNHEEEDMSLAAFQMIINLVFDLSIAEIAS